jgi:hypothetical protein
VRRRRAAEQRIWVGPDRYFCGCEQRIAHTNAYGDGDCNSNRGCDSDTNRNCNGYSYSYSHSDAYTYRQAPSNSEASSDIATSPVEILGRQNFY